MGMSELEEGLRLVREHPDRCDFIGSRSEDLVEAAETALGISFPPTYRRFVRELGAAAVGSQEIYGVTGHNFDEGTVPNAIWLTRTERQESALPRSMIIVGDTGMGEWYVLDVAQGGEEEPPVQVIQSAIDGQGYEVVDEAAPDFGTFFLKQVRFGLEHPTED